MKKWEQRSPEIAYGLNPAYYALLLYEAVSSFQNKRDSGMPFALALLILPLLFYTKVRERLPHNERTSLYEWLKEYPEVRIDFPRKVSQLLPYTRESMIFAIQQSVIEINQQGNFIVVKERVKKKVLKQLDWPKDSTAASGIEKAKLLGKWFAFLGGNAESIYRSLGIRL